MIAPFPHRLMKRSRTLHPLGADFRPMKCECGRPSRFVLTTETEMGGKFLGTGKTKITRTYRCEECAPKMAAKFGLTVPRTDEAAT